MTPSTDVIPNVHKIAVLRANALGDFIFVLPALDALRTAYPQAEIVLLAKEWHSEFLKYRQSPVDRVIVVPPFQGVSMPASFRDDPDHLEDFFEEMTRERFDLAIQLHGGGRYSNPFVHRLNAKTTIGLRTRQAMPLDRSIPYVHWQSEILRFLEVVSLVGAKPITLEPKITVTENDLAEVCDILTKAKMLLVALHPGSGSLTRRWPPEKFATVGDALARTGVSVVVTGTPPEEHLVTAVVDMMEAKAQNLCGHLSLGGLAGLLSRCAVVVSNDSGPLHLAEAVGAATVGIYWIGNVITAAPVSRTYHRVAISWRIHCPVCGHECTRTRCEHRPSFVTDVPTEEVIDSALDLLRLHQSKFESR